MFYVITVYTDVDNVHAILAGQNGINLSPDSQKGAEPATRGESMSTVKAKTL